MFKKKEKFGEKKENIWEIFMEAKKKIKEEYGECIGYDKDWKPIFMKTPQEPEQKCPLRVHPYGRMDTVILCPVAGCLHILLPDEKECPCHSPKEAPKEFWKNFDIDKFLEDCKTAGEILKSKELKQEEVKETLYDYEKKNNLCGEPVESSNLMVNKICGNKKPCSKGCHMAQKYVRCEFLDKKK